MKEDWYDPEYCWMKLKDMPVYYIDFIPEEVLTYDMCIYAVSEIPGMIFTIPPKFRDDEMWIIVVLQQWNLIDHMHPLSLEVAKAAVKTHRFALDHIDRNKYPDIYEECSLLIL